MLFFNHIENALASVKSNRLRSILTASGITIGIASITAILTLSTSVTEIVRQQVDHYGGTLAVVTPAAPQKNLPESVQQLSGSANTASSLTQKDVETLNAIEHVTAAAPLMVLQGAVSGDISPSGTSHIIATTPELKTTNSLNMHDGQFLDLELDDTTAVIGHSLAIDLFGTDQVIGKLVEIRGDHFRIIGVLKPTFTPLNFNSVDFDTSVFISLKSGVKQNEGSAHIQQINLVVDSVAHLDGVLAEAHKLLLKNHLSRTDFLIATGDAIAQPTSHLFGLLTSLTVAVAAISLLVGGIGIMNSMLVGVAERTREIGIRKAMGATSGTIVMQFITESLFLSIIGGVFGYLIGTLLGVVASILLGVTPVFSLTIMALALAFSVITGTVFGAYPAFKAARKDPITALRLYN